MTRLAAEMVKQRKGREEALISSTFMIDLTGGPCVHKRLSGCGSGTEYLAVTPWGDLYPCHQFVGQEEFLMGNVDEGIVKTGYRGRVQVLQRLRQRKMQRTALPDFTAAAAVRQIPINFHGTIQGCL